MSKIITDLVMTSGKYSYKRLTATFILLVSVVYAFIPLWRPEFEVLEFVFWGMLTYSASMAGLTLYQKNLEYKNTSSNVNSQYTNDESGTTY